MVVGQFTTEAQLVVVGGGAGGYAAALRAARHGLQTVIVDPRGTSPHLAWLSSRTLADAAGIVRAARHAAQYGLQFIEPTLDLTRLREWTHQVGDALTTRLEQQCIEAGIEVIRGRAAFESARQVTVHDGSAARIHFKRAIIATGATIAERWPGIPAVTDAEGLLARDGLPESLLVIGGSFTGLELACACAALGCGVCLAAENARVLPEADEDIARPLERRLARAVAELCLGTTVGALRAAGDGVEAELQSPAETKVRRFDHAVVALGRAPNTTGLDLAKAQVETDGDGAIRVDESLRTSNPRIFAVGDVTGHPMLANRAIAQGRVAADAAAGVDAAFDPQAIPSVVFCDPPVAWCGLTEAEAVAGGIAHEVLRIDWSSSGRAVSLARSDGLTKLIVEPGSGLLLGAGIVGEGAAELIGEAALAIEMGAVAEDLAEVIHPHPTMGELTAEAAQRTG